MNLDKTIRGFYWDARALKPKSFNRDDRKYKKGEMCTVHCSFLILATAPLASSSSVFEVKRNAENIA